MKKLSLSNRLFREIPDKWNELSFDQLKYLSYLLSENIPVPDLKIKFFLCLAGLKPCHQYYQLINDEKWYWFHSGKDKILIASSHLNWASECVLNFFNIDENGNYYPSSTLTRNIFPVIKAGDYKITGPADALTNITFKEFMHAEKLHYDYIKDHNESHLDKLIAVLFRPINGNLKISDSNYVGDLRISFNDFQIDFYAVHTSQINKCIKSSIFFFYEGCKKHICAMFPHVYRKTTGQIKDVDIAREMLSIVDELSGHKPQDNENIFNENMYMVLNSLENLIKKTSKDE